MKIKIGKDLVSFPVVRRGNLDIKVSSSRNNQVLIIAQHIQFDSCVVKMCYSEIEAANYINFLEERDELL